MNLKESKSNWRRSRRNVDTQWSKLRIVDLPRKSTIALSLIVGLTMMSFASPAIADNDNNERRGQDRGHQGRQDNRQENRRNYGDNRANERAQNHAQSRADDRAWDQAQNRADERARDQAQNRADNWAQNQAQNRADERARAQAQNRADDRARAQAQNRADERNRNQAQSWGNNRVQNGNRWDYRLDNRQRYQTYRKYRNNWTDQRTYLRSNLSRFNQLSRLNAQQQRLMDNQMRAAFLSYHNNQWNGSYGWDNYSDPQFLDYLQTSQPSLLQSVLSAIGLGGNDNYLYSSNWDSERSQLAQNMARIQQLSASGRISPSQARQLQGQLQAEFMAYKNNSWNGSVGWSQYSEPGFVDYLHNRRPTLLTTIRDYQNM